MCSATRLMVWGKGLRDEGPGQQSEAARKRGARNETQRIDQQQLVWKAEKQTGHPSLSFTRIRPTFFQIQPCFGGVAHTHTHTPYSASHETELSPPHT